MLCGLNKKTNNLPSDKANLKAQIVAKEKEQESSRIETTNKHCFLILK